MKYPSLAAGVIVVLGILITQLFTLNGILIACIFIIASIIFSIIIKNKQLVFITFFLLVSFLSVAGNNAIISKNDVFHGKTLHICGRINHVYYDGKYKLTPIKATLNGKEVAIKGDIVANTGIGNLKIHTELEGDAYISKTYDKAILSDGAFLTAKFNANTKAGDKIILNKFDFSFYIRNYIDNAASMLGGREGSFLTSLLTGDKSELDKDILESFRNIGLSHLLAVSGLHLSVCMGFWIYMLKGFGIPVKLRIILSVTAIMAILIMANFSPSVCRAGVMGLIVCLSQILQKGSNSINSLGFSVLLLSIINPWIIYDIGFILSVAATLGIIILVPILTKNLWKVKSEILKYMLNILAVSFSASIAVIPISAIYFKHFAIIGLLSNLIFNPIIFLLLTTGFIFILLHKIPVLTAVLLPILRKAIKIFLDLTLWFGNHSQPRELNHLPMILLLAFLILTLLIILLGIKIRTRLIAVSISIVYFFAFVCSFLNTYKIFSINISNQDNINFCYAQNENSLVIFDCKNIDCAIILSSLLKDTHAIYILNNYDNTDVAKYLLQNQLIDKIVLPDFDNDKKYDIIDFANKYGINTVFVSKRTYLCYNGIELYVCPDKIYSTLSSDYIYVYGKINNFSFIYNNDKKDCDIAILNNQILSGNDTILITGQNSINLYENGEFKIQRKGELWNSLRND